MNRFLIMKVISHLTQDQIETYYDQFPNCSELKSAYDLLIDSLDDLEKAFKKGNRFGIYKIDRERFAQNISDDGLFYACRYAQRDLVDLMIQKGANNWNLGLSGACQVENNQGKEALKISCELVNLMVEKGADEWNGGLKSACYAGRSDLAELMIQKGATDWNGGFENACLRGDRDLVELMIQKGAIYLDEGLYYVCHGANRKNDSEDRLEVIELLISHGASDWSLGLRGACNSGRRDLADLMIQYGATDWNRGLCIACSRAHQNLVDLMIQKGANYCRFCGFNGDEPHKTFE